MKSKLIIFISCMLIMVAAAQAQTTITDNTLIERYLYGEPAGGWKELIGGPIFDTKQIDVSYNGPDVTITIYTDFPEYTNLGGTERGWEDGYLYHAADLAIDLDQDGTYETGIGLYDHGEPPQDPRDEGYIPGAFMDADDFKKGKIYSVTAWFTPTDLHNTTSSVGELFDQVDPKMSMPWMKKGTEQGSAQVSWENHDGISDYKVTILLEDVNANGAWNHFDIFWGTATCSNDGIHGSIHRPGDEIPEFSTLGMLGAVALLGLFVLKHR